MNRILLILLIAVAVAGGAFVIFSDTDGDSSQKTVNTASAPAAPAPENSPAAPTPAQTPAQVQTPTAAEKPAPEPKVTAAMPAVTAPEQEPAAKPEKPEAVAKAPAEPVTPPARVAPKPEAPKPQVSKPQVSKPQAPKPQAPAPKAPANAAPKPVAPAAAAPAVTPAPAKPKPVLLAPSFDIVRISDVDCTAVLAGRAAPNVTLDILANGQVLATLQVGRDGQWSHVTDAALPQGGVELSLASSRGSAAAQSEDTVILSVPDCARLDNTEKAIALLAPKNQTGTRILQAPPSAKPLDVPGRLRVDKVDYDEAGNIELSGRADRDSEVRAYVDGAYAGRATADGNGGWRIVPEMVIEPGVHTVRVDQVAEAGGVVARVELPFERVSVAALAQPEARVIVQPGNSLWRIARRTYGRGIQYTVIYQANQDRIRDPDLIYPGQIFRLPDTE